MDTESKSSPRAPFVVQVGSAEYAAIGNQHQRYLIMSTKDGRPENTDIVHIWNGGRGFAAFITALHRSEEHPGIQPGFAVVSLFENLIPLTR